MRHDALTQLPLMYTTAKAMLVQAFPPSAFLGPHLPTDAHELPAMGGGSAEPRTVLKHA